MSSLVGDEFRAGGTRRAPGVVAARAALAVRALLVTSIACEPTTPSGSPGAPSVMSSVGEGRTSHSGEFAGPTASANATPSGPSPASASLEPSPERALRDLDEFARSCDTRDASWRVRVRPRTNRRKTLAAIQRVLSAASVVCEPGGWVELFSDTTTLKRLYGDHLDLSCVEGMGNSSDVPGFFAKVEPEGHLPGELAAHAREVRLDDDPKSELWGEVVDCEKRYR